MAHFRPATSGSVEFPFADWKRSKWGFSAGRKYLPSIVCLKESTRAPNQKMESPLLIPKPPRTIACKWIRFLTIQCPLWVTGSLLFCLFCPGLNFRISGETIGLTRRTSDQGRSFFFKIGSFSVNYEADPELAHDDGMFCGEFRTGSGWTWRKGLAQGLGARAWRKGLAQGLGARAWRKGLAYAGTETRWFIGLRR